MKLPLKYTGIGLLLVFMSTSAGCAQKPAVRKTAVAGQFYPANKKTLTSVVERYIETAPDYKIKGEILGLIIPHAGYVYSGKTAACGIKTIQNKEFDTVILIGSSHKHWLKKATVDTSDAYATPLGNIPVDRKIAGQIIKASPLIEANSKAHISEHSLEVELPFLQAVSENFKVIPILLGNFSIRECENIAKAIFSVVRKHKDRKFLYIVSTDMSHYPEQKQAEYIDNIMLDALKGFNPVSFKKESTALMARGYSNLSCTLCGETAVITAMYLTKALGADKIEVLEYTNSGEVSGDKSRVVGYCAAAFIDTSSVKKEEEEMAEFSISEKNQKILLDLARESIGEYLKSKKLPEFKTTDEELSTPAAVFVTLNKNHRLRGCIGTTAPRAPLYEAVSQLALSSAFEDYRFPPVNEKELKDIRIEISVLSPMSRVKSADEIKQNIHGVVVRRNGRSGLFLPQVWEHFSKKEDFLGELCAQKAGLSRDAWKDSKTELYIFTVFAFEED